MFTRTPYSIFKNHFIETHFKKTTNEERVLFPSSKKEITILHNFHQLTPKILTTIEVEDTVTDAEFINEQEVMILTKSGFLQKFKYTKNQLFLISKTDVFGVQHFDKEYAHSVKVCPLKKFCIIVTRRGTTSSRIFLMKINPEQLIYCQTSPHIDSNSNSYLKSIQLVYLKKSKNRENSLVLICFPNDKPRVVIVYEALQDRFKRIFSMGSSLKGNLVRVEKRDFFLFAVDSSARFSIFELSKFNKFN